MSPDMTYWGGHTVTPVGELAQNAQPQENYEKTSNKSKLRVTLQNDWPAFVTSIQDMKTSKDLETARDWRRLKRCDHQILQDVLSQRRDVSGTTDAI